MKTVNYILRLVFKISKNIKIIQSLCSHSKLFQLKNTQFIFFLVITKEKHTNIKLIKTW